MAVGTVGEAWNSSWRIHMRCAAERGEGMTRHRECVYRAELDLETLVCTRGRDFPLSLLPSRMRCPRCGSREVALLFDPPAASGRARASNR